MREILFRGKRLDNGEWVEGHLHILFDGTTLIISKGAGGFTISHGEDIFQTAHVYEVDPETVGQFTGLTDKKGRKIFEGDILKTWRSVGQKGELRGEYMQSLPVEYCDLWCQFVAIDNPQKVQFPIWQSFGAFEVIGNRWDNPELLEGVG